MYLPRYRLLRRIRVHDFHRNPLPSFPVTPERFMGIGMQGPPGKFIGMQGPVRLSASGNRRDYEPHPQRAGVLDDW